MKTRQLAAAALALAGASLAGLVGARRWHQHWGATDEEIARPLPGDDLIADSKFDSTHAITIHAPVEQVWPWLSQAGYGGRAGFYSYDLLERRFGARNTDRRGEVATGQRERRRCEMSGLHQDLSLVPLGLR